MESDNTVVNTAAKLLVVIKAGMSPVASLPKCMMMKLISMIRVYFHSAHGTKSTVILQTFTTITSAGWITSAGPCRLDPRPRSVEWSLSL